MTSLAQIAPAFVDMAHSSCRARAEALPGAGDARHRPDHPRRRCADLAGM